MDSMHFGAKTMKVWTTTSRIALSTILALTNMAPTAAGAMYYQRFTEGVILENGSAPVDPQQPLELSYQGVKGNSFSQKLPSYASEYSWSIKGGSLPSGILFDAANLTFAGTPASAGSGYDVELLGVNTATGLTLSLKVSFLISESSTSQPSAPDIADVSKTVLGSVGAAISSWMPQVVNSNGGGAWDAVGATFHASHDLSQYGLTFNEYTGMISGTPTAPFILRNFAVTVTGADGSSDTTAPFWIGVAPAGDLAVSESQKFVYVLRHNMAFATDPVVVENSIGDLTFSRPDDITSGWNSATGVWALPGGGQPEEWLGEAATHIVTIADEFGRSVSWSFATQFTESIVAAATDSNAYIGTAYTASNPVAVPTADGVLGIASWSATGLPSGLTVDGTTGIVTGTIPEATVADGDTFAVVFSVTDSYDGKTASATATITVRNAEFVVANNGGDTQTIKALTEQASLSYSARYRASNEAYTPGVTWTLVSGTLPSGVVATPLDDGEAGNSRNLAYSKYPTEVGTYDNIVWRAQNSAGQQVLTKPITLVVVARDPLTLSAAPSAAPVAIVRQDAVSVKITPDHLALGTQIAPADWSVTGSLPTGITSSVEGDGLRIQGVSTEVGTFNVTVTAKDAAGGTASIPVQITVNPSLEGEVSAGGSHSCAITPVGGVKCWGNNANGQLGDGTTTSSSVPVNVVGLASGVTSISTGDTFTCAVTTSGGAKCWGYNGNGELGNNSTVNSPVPVDVAGLTSGVASVSAGYVHACAVTSSGAAKCWGDNINGQLGNASTTDSLVPVQVSGLAGGVASITTGVRHSCVVNAAGGVQCWGLNQYGALGNNSTTSSNVPVQVSGLTSGVTSVSGGYRHTCATTTSGKVKCWGFNNVGQLGDNSTTNRTTPVDVANLSNVQQIGLSEGHVCAVTTAGGAYCWGYNNNGQLGDNSIADRSVPTQVFGLTAGVTSVTAGFRHSCASMDDGSLKCWGLGTGGRLGNGGTSQSNVPVNVSG